MTEPEKQFIIGINTEVERPEGWTAGQGGNLTFTASTLAADLAAALARAETAERHRDTWKAHTHLRTKQLAIVEANLADWRKRAEAAEARAEVFRIGVNNLATRIAALDAASRAVVDAVWSPHTNVYLARSLICRICRAPDGRHSQSCPVRALAALLDGEGA
jgi:hypothetical protein